MTTEGSNDTTAGQRPDGRRRGLLLVAIVFAFLAWTAASWTRLASPFSTAEAAALHEVLRESGQVIDPKLSEIVAPRSVPFVALLQQLVGATERPLRVAVLLMLLVAAVLLAETASKAEIASALIPLAALLSLTPVATIVLLRPEMIVLAPAALALMVLRPFAVGRALVGVAGAIGAGALHDGAGIAVAIVMVVAALVQGSVADRLLKVLVAVSAIVASWMARGAREVPRISFSFDSIQSGALEIGRFLPGEWWQGPLLPAIILGLIVVLGLASRTPERRTCFGLLAGIVVALLVLGVTMVDGQRIGTNVAYAALAAPIILLVALCAQALPLPGRMIVVLLFAAAAAAPLAFQGTIAPRPDALGLLARARSLQTVQSGIAIGGDMRIVAAVYARLGHHPGMEIFFVPEDVTLESLAAACRARAVRFLWLYPHPATAPPGFTAPASRPIDTAGTMPLVLDG